MSSRTTSGRKRSAASHALAVVRRLHQVADAAAAAGPAPRRCRRCRRPPARALATAARPAASADAAARRLDPAGASAPSPRPSGSRTTNSLPCPGPRCAPRPLRRAARRGRAPAPGRGRARPRRAPPAGAHLRELLEQPRQVGARDADAVVADADRDASPSQRAPSARCGRRGGVYLQAFCSRLATTCVSRVGSPSTISGAAAGAASRSCRARSMAAAVVSTLWCTTSRELDPLQPQRRACWR